MLGDFIPRGTCQNQRCLAVLLAALSIWDYGVVVVYLLGMLALGGWLSLRSKTDEEYFLGGRRMPWFAVGVSVIASLLSSLTYLSEPGEVWQSGITHFTGKMLAIPLEVIIVWAFCIPFMMRFRFTSAYEYLEHRFGVTSRRLGVALFICLVVSWMGFVVLASSRALSQVTGVPLLAVILTVGVVATIYTMLGGLRAVIWTDVVQVVLLFGGAIFAVAFVAWQTGSSPLEWYSEAQNYLATNKPDQATVTWASLDPFVRVTVLGAAANMCVWHVCTHTANQMTVQRYFSTADAKAARRSFMTGTVLGVLINTLLWVVGLSLLYYYMVYLQGELPRGVDPTNGKTLDLVFPMFVVDKLPAGAAGAILAALLAAAMSSIDSAVNSVATVLTVEANRTAEQASADNGSGPTSASADSPAKNHVTEAMWITLVVGVLITGAAYGLDFITGEKNIVEMMPRSFNLFTVALGGLFLTGIFISWTGEIGALLATFVGMATSISLAFGKEISAQLVHWEIIPVAMNDSVSFTWIMPVSLLVTLLVAAVAGLVDRAPPRKQAGLTWRNRREPAAAGILKEDL